MRFDAKAMAGDAGIFLLLEGMLEDAYKQGYNSGHAAAVARIMHAVADPLLSLPEASDDIPRTVEAEEPIELSDPDGVIEVNGFRRAPRGLVQTTVEQIVARTPGLSIAEYERLVTEAEPEIATKSVGNELRRGEAINKYKRDRPGGYRWFPYDFGNEGDGSTLPAAPSPSYLFNQEGGDGLGPATT